MKMKHTGIMLTLAAAAAASHAGVITQTEDYVWDVHQGNEFHPLNFQAFDTQGGTRFLDAVTIEVESSFTLDIITENGEDYDVGPADGWFLRGAVFNNFRILESDYLIPGVGGWLFGPLTGDMAASDGVERSGDDSILWSYEETLAGSRSILPFDFQRFEGAGDLGMEIYPFLSLELPPPPPFFDIWIEEHIHSGSVTLTYEFTSVPAPSGAALFSLVTLAAARRRRR